MFKKENLEILRSEMKKAGLKAYLIVTGDPHDSEEPAPYWGAERNFFCPFSGDNAQLLITQKDAYLFTDGRFFISAEMELKDSTIKLMKMGTKGYPTVQELIKEDELYPLGINELTISPAFLKSLTNKKSTIVDSDFSYLVSPRPSLCKEKIWRFDQSEYNTLTRDQKIEQILNEVEKKDAEANLITTLDDIAWILNLRGNDINCTPVFYSYLYLSKKVGNHLFVDTSRIDYPLDNITIHPYEEISSFLDENKNVATLVDPSRCNAKLYNILNNRIDGKAPSSLMKAIKGEVEIKNIIEIQELDGVALLKLIDFIDTHKNEKLTEWDYAVVLEKFRRESPRLIEPSFTTIAACGPNAAMMHYAPSEKVHAVVDLTNTIELLVDSGGQYYGGTTDTTRTFLIGKPTKEFIHDYTLTLKSVINLSRTIFLDGSSGVTIDIKAREIMWREGMDYKCGTGHGVGYVLPVHEGPNGFRYRVVPNRDDSNKLVPGMITTIEPGVYKEGKYGIRIENNLLTVPAFETSDGVFYKFQDVTYVPIETKALDLSLLSDDEIEYLNNYHQDVYNRLSKYVNGHLLEVLKEKTKKVSR